MISFPGYDDVIREIYYHNQDHVFEYWDELEDREKKSLLEDLSSVDISQLSVLFSTASDESQIKYSYTPAGYVPVPHTEEDRARCREARSRGEQHVRDGKVAAFLVAGGQGTRLGFDGPKGAYPVGPVSGKSLFQIHGEKIRAYSKKYDTVIP
jgi:UDP-N-acetylglucosamine/UDP-N-acetylgalactosamine diphosphorylase